jgi:hypothetical protein
VSGRAPAAALLCAGLVACGVKAPPRAAGAPDRSPPSDLFRPAEDPNRPGTDFIKPDVEVVTPVPEPGTAPAAPPGPEPAR